MVTSKLYMQNWKPSLYIFFFLTTATFGLDWDLISRFKVFSPVSRQNSKNAHRFLPWLFSNLGTAVKRSTYGKEIILDDMSGSSLITQGP